MKPPETNIQVMSSQAKDKPKPSICFVAHFAYGSLSGKPTGHIGGVEKQVALVAKWFAAHGYPVSMLTWDEGHPDGQPIHGVRVFNICRSDQGVRGLRFIHPRWTGLVRAAARANSDIYFQNCGECVTGQIAAWCRLHGKKFIYSVANDTDVDPRLPEMKTLRERFLYRYGLQHADCVIAQTRHQQRSLWTGWGIESTLVPMTCDFWSGKPFSRVEPPKPGKIHILWIGRFAHQKRFEWLIEIAHARPDFHFDVVGHANSQSPQMQSLEEQARQLDNVTLHGFVPYENLYNYYLKSSLMLCTSRFEGFPNTFLEAWSLGLPIVSTFDPDNMIRDHNLGRVADDIPGLIHGICELTNSPEQWHTASDNACNYYHKNHTVDTVLTQYQYIFEELCREGT
jgi:glycosyltransferase involved in cell wall biosynthesis